MMMMEDAEGYEVDLDTETKSEKLENKVRRKKPAPPKVPNATRGRASLAGKTKHGARMMLAIEEAGEEILGDTALGDDALEDLVSAAAATADAQRKHQSRDRARSSSLGDFAANPFHDLVVEVPLPRRRAPDLPKSPTLQASAAHIVGGSPKAASPLGQRPTHALMIPKPNAISRRNSGEASSPLLRIAAMDRVRARVRHFVDEGMKWRGLFDEAVLLEPHDQAEPNLLPARLFRTCLCDGLGVSSEDFEMLCSGFRAKDNRNSSVAEKVHYAAFLEQALPTWGSASWECVERFRVFLLREMQAWGAADNVDAIFADLTDAQAAANGKLRASEMRKLARRLRCQATSDADLAVIFAAMRPCMGPSGPVLLCDFAGFVQDPRFHADVLPRLVAPLRSMPTNEVASQLRSAFKGVSSMRSFRAALTRAGIEGLSRDEVVRTARRFAKDSTYRAFHHEALVTTICDYLSSCGPATPSSSAVEEESKTEYGGGDYGCDSDVGEYDDNEGEGEEKSSINVVPKDAAPQVWTDASERFNTRGSSDGLPLHESSIESEPYIIDDDSDDEECEVERYGSTAGDQPRTTLQEVNMGDSDEEEDPATSDKATKSSRDAPWFLRDNEISRRLAPARDDILDFAIYLGMDPEQDKAWLWLAEECLYAPLPKGWCQARDESSSGRGDVYYWRRDDPRQKTQWEHPLDPFFRKLYERLKQDKAQRVLDAKSMGRVRRGPRRSGGAGAGDRPMSAHVLSRADQAEDSAELNLLRRIARRTAQLEPLDEPAPESVLGDGPLDPTAKRRPVSAIARRSNRVMPAGNLLGGDREEDEVSNVLSSQREAHRKRKKNPRVLPLGSLAGYAASLSSTRSPNGGEEVPELKLQELPLPRPLPEDELRPVWWLHGTGQVRRRLAGTNPASFRRQLAPEDVLEVANYLGISLPGEAHLMWIAKAAALSPIPPRWRLCFDEFTDEHFFANEDTFAVSRAHPLDPFWSLLLDAERVLGARDSSATAGEAWVSFYDEDEDVYFYEFSSAVTRYELPEDVGSMTAPAVVRAGCCGASSSAQETETERTSTEALARREADAFRLSLWAELDAVDDLESPQDRARAPLARLLAWPFSQMLGKLDLIKLTLLLDWLVEPCTVALEAAKRTRSGLRSAVQARRDAAEQLTKHITLRSR